MRAVSSQRRQFRFSHAVAHLQGKVAKRITQQHGDLGRIVILRINELIHEDAAVLRLGMLQRLFAHIRGELVAGHWGELSLTIQTAAPFTRQHASLQVLDDASAVLLRTHDDHALHDVVWRQHSRDLGERTLHTAELILHERAHERVHLIQQWALHLLGHLLEHLLDDTAGIWVRGESLKFACKGFRQRLWRVNRNQALLVSSTRRCISLSLT